MEKKHLYRITFIQQDKVYELYAKSIIQSDLFGFVEISELVFDDSSIVVDPQEDRLRQEFMDVETIFVTVHAVIRIDVVKKKGSAKIKDYAGAGSDKVTFLPNAQVKK